MLSANIPHVLQLPTRCEIVAVEQENYRTKTLVLGQRIDATAGQFVMAWLPRFDEKPFSLVHCDPVTLMITAVGPFSQLVHQKVAGDSLWIRGPFGQGFHAPAGGVGHVVMAAGGYGVAPILWLAQAWQQLARRITIVVGARVADDILFMERFQRLVHASATEIALQVTTEDGSRGIRGQVTTALEPALRAGAVDLICGCGPHGMLAALADLGRRYGVPCQLSWEAYMRCGIGICGSCEHNGKVLCLDGPVLAS
jgi:dihydroorotate dehydrogenase electron transfer subunit